jgi:4-hydroxybenzoate polyprenyltransferase
VPHLRSLPLERGSGSALPSLVRALRPHQWLKNLLILVPALAAHRFDPQTLVALGLAFVSFSLCASGGYVFNDLLDVSADRQHATKRRRPFASGDLSPSAGILLVLATWLAGFGLAWLLLPAPYGLTVALYLASTTAYSVRLKREAVLDVMVLAGLYAIRVIAGGVATGIPVSTWLLAFTVFISLSLAFLKRFIELRSHPGALLAAPPGRGYLADDAIWLHAIGLSSAYLAAVVLAIYANSADVVRLYGHPERLLLICPVLMYGATRLWLKAHRGLMHDDPVVAVASDRATYVMVGVGAAVLLSAIW